MTVTSGMRLGPCEVGAALGSGGMGEVYRARDTKLGREAALEVLPPAFADDDERLARFRREAQILASLKDLGGGPARTLLTAPEGSGILSAALSRDGRHLAWHESTDERDIWLAEFEGKR